MTQPQPAPAPQTRDHLLSNKAYNVINFIALVLLPALATLYFALAAIWDLPYAEQIVGTITAVDAFLGGLVAVSKSSYNASEAKYDGTINVVDTPTKTTYSLELNDDPALLAEKDQVLLNVHEPIIEHPQ